MERPDDLGDDERSLTAVDLLVATADSSAPLLDDSVPELRRAMPQRMNTDVVVVSGFVEPRLRARPHRSHSGPRSR
jgi:hypothetical protein